MKTAIVLFNLGGPDTQEAVRPFLTNLFRDKHIIGLPNPLRWFLAHVIAKKRTPVAAEIYRYLGGGSPLLENTVAQATALESALQPMGDFKTFIAMNYWHPFARQTVTEVKAYQPDRIILLPLYPQWSYTTSASSLKVWNRAMKQAGYKVPTTTLCCYPTEAGFIETLARLTRQALAEASSYGKPRVLFSAHGLPERVIQSGDPYQWQCEETAKAIAAALNQPDLEWINTYQSRVGPLKWIGPATDEEIIRAGAEKRPLIVVPIAFVSEHSETLVELDIEYKHLADTAGVPAYIRVATTAIDPDFIAGLARLVQQAAQADVACLSQNGSRLCPSSFRHCALAECPV